MSKTSIFLLLLLFFSIGGYFYFTSQTPTIPLNEHQSVKATVSTAPTTMISFTQLKTAQSITLAVHIDDKKVNSTLIQLEIGYDPMALDIEKIQPGTYFTTTPVIFKNVNEHLGRITYALTCDQSNQQTCERAPDETLALVTFSPHLPVSTQSTIVELLPKTYLKNDKGEQVSVKRNNISISLDKSEKVASNAGILPEEIKQ